ncbi:endo-1,4-beta-xylanase [Clostridium thermarum]|uniref:endo-1,4-beta-xylanase n=1 Tax=Clostridium thermarum TaxID=1716543 RepID=UPI0013D0E148|nr:endo-1,4-beta-xylanase [Clostridium thermarum]
MKRKVSKILSYVLSACMVVGLWATTPVQRVSADTPTEDDIIVNETFEDGTTSHWTPRGPVALTAVTEAAASGDYSMKVTGRTSTWNGPSINLNGYLAKGSTYNISLKVKVVPGQAEEQAENTNQLITVTMLRRESTATSDSYDTIAYQTTVNEESWTTITGTYTPAYDSYTTLALYVESPNATLEFYVDDVVITGHRVDNGGTVPRNPNAPPAGTNIVSNPDFENGTADGWYGRGTAQIEATQEDAASGEYSLKVTGRTQNWNGPAVSLIDKINLGSTYTVSLKVKAVPGQSGLKNVSVTTERTIDGAQSWTGLKSNVGISDSYWTTIETEMSLLDATPAMTQLDLYVESSNENLEFYVDDVSVVEVGGSGPLPVQTDIPSLQDVFKDYFTIGGAVVPETIATGSLSEQLVRKHYAMIVPGNHMKPDALQGTEGNFTFEYADKIVDYAIANNMSMRGHTLVWHSQIPDWFFQDPDDPSKPASKELLLERERTHITTVLKHFKEKYGDDNPIVYWDVVNEVIGDDGNYRNSKWYQIAGPDYIKVAFEAAHEADPDMKLVINDYNIENNGAKTQKFYQVVKELLEAGTPIDAIGMQMHMSTNTSMDAVKASIEKLAELGLEIQITELDLTIEDSPITSASYAKQARMYKQFFDFIKTKDYIDVVMIWGVTDADSWRGDKVPLLFDRRLQAKDAYWAIVDPSEANMDRQSAKSAEGSPKNADDVIWSTIQPISANIFASGLDGASAKVQTMWDNQNLYIKAYISDATPNDMDSVDIYIDKKGDRSTSYQSDDEHINVKRDECSRDATGYTVYKVIPIADYSPELGKTIGFDIRVNDDKGSGNVDSQAVWNDYANRQDTNTAYFGDLVLSSPSLLANAAYGTPTIDGTIDSVWNKATSLETNTWVQGNSGATAKFRTLWNENELYVLAEVKDDHLNKANVNDYEQDSIEIFLDQNNNKTAYYQADDYQLRVNYDNQQSFGSTGPLEGFRSATKITDKGYIVEAAIPLSAITPKAGTIIGFDLQVNNADDSGSRVSVVTWCDPSGNSWSSTSGLGNLQFVANQTEPGTGGGTTPDSGNEPGDEPDNGDEETPAEKTVLRFGGSDRYETSIKISQAGWTTADSAVLVRGDDFADTLSAVPFAVQMDAPLLLTYTNYLDSRIVGELNRLQVKTVYIIGGPGAISVTVENTIKAMGISVERIGGADRYATSLAIANKMPVKEQVFLVTGKNYADALSISSYAAAAGSPILLTDGTRLTAEVSKFIKDNNSKVYVIGGTGVISEAAVKGIAKAERIAGNDRYATNLAVLEKFAAEYDFSSIYLATGSNYPDAICGSVLAGKEKAPMILLGNKDITSQKTFVKSVISKVSKVKVLGGEGVLTPGTVESILN